jgi:hypothetical protein
MLNKPTLKWLNTGCKLHVIKNKEEPATLSPPELHITMAISRWNLCNLGDYY